MQSAILLLLVEDDLGILELLEAELSEGGFEIVPASDGRRALAELEADCTRFRGIVTDVRLGPGPDGWEVGRRARELAPTIPVVYTTGDSAHEWTSKGVPNSVMVQKPFAPAQITTAISQLINSAVPPFNPPG